MIGEWFDKMIGVVSPRHGLERTLARQNMLRVRGYEAGKRHRLNRNWRTVSESGNAPNLGEVQLSRYRAWELFRNNHIARKAVRTIVAQVVGCGMRHEPAAEDASGKSRDALNEQSGRVFSQWSRRVTVDPIGAGGYGFGFMQALALQELILSGEFLVRFIRLNPDQAEEMGLPLPLALQFIEAERLAEDATGLGNNAQNVFRGIEFDDNDNRVAYHIYRYHPSDPRVTRHQLEVIRVPASDILHVFLPDRIGQHRGVTWLAPIISGIRDLGDYQQNEITASSVASCVSFWIEQAFGGPPGLALPSGQESTDKDGNTITTLQPGMQVRLRPGEKVNAFNPMRPNTNAVDFINNLMRGMAGGVPGVKPSTLTGDYRNATFSSERAADNDAWRETEIVQDFFAASFCQPIYEAVQEVAVLSNRFDGRMTRLEQRNAFRCNWHGPVKQSIQPDTDARAASLSVSAGISSPQLEAAGVGTDWRQNIKSTAEAYKFAQSQGLPEVVCLRVAGMENVQASQPQEDSEDEPAKPANGNSRFLWGSNHAAHSL